MSPDGKIIRMVTVNVIVMLVVPSNNQREIGGMAEVRIE